MTITVPPSDMLLFAAVVREGGFTRAAKQLGLTKQTVSERIARLEERLGVRLLERTTRRLRTTDVGAMYFERCSQIAAQIDEANSAVQQRLAEPTGLLRVTAPVLYGHHFLAPVIADYMGRYPKTRVELILADRRVNLIEEGFDLAIRIGQLDDSSLTARKLGEGHLYCVASPAFLKQHGLPDVGSLRSTRCIGTRPFETWTIGGAPRKIEPVLVVNDLQLACDAAIAGIGIALLPSLVCQEALATGRLRLVFEPEPAMMRPVYAVYPSRQHLPAKVRAFVDAVAALVEPMLPLDVSMKNAGATARPRRRSRA